MKYECTHNLQMNGKVYKRGVVVELTPEQAKIYHRNWKPIGVVPEKTPEESAKEAEDLKTRRSVMAKLDQLGIAYKARDTYEELLQRLQDSGTASELRR